MKSFSKNLPNWWNFTLNEVVVYKPNIKLSEHLHRIGFLSELYTIIPNLLSMGVVSGS